MTHTIKTAKEFDAIFVLGGWLVQNTDGSWRTTNFEEANPNDAFGDSLRVHAVPHILSTLRNDAQKPVVVVSGSAGKLAKLGAPPVAQVMAGELAKLKVPRDCMIVDKESGSTYEQLQTLAAMVQAHQWRRVMILSSRYHLGRVRAMIDHAPSLSLLAELSRAGDLVPWSAESALIEYAQNDWQDIIEKAYLTEHVRNIIVAEEKGIEDIVEGRYRFSALWLRDATLADTDFLFQLRNEEAVRLSSWTTEPIAFATHQAWVAKLLQNPNRILLFIAESDGNPVGQIRYDIDEKGVSAEVSIAFAESSRGKGFGTEALQRTASIIFARFPKIDTLYAHIKPDNTGSVGSFAKAGYRKTEQKEHDGHSSIEMTKAC